MTLTPELLSILVCPQCKESVEPIESDTWLVCRSCRIKYPVTEGIPVMLVDEAVLLDGL